MTILPEHQCKLKDCKNESLRHKPQSQGDAETRLLYCEEHKHEGISHVYRTTTSQYQNDIRLFWNRVNYYLIIEGLLLTFFFSNEISTQQEIVVSVLGIIVALIWTVIGNQSYLWMRIWGFEVKKIDNLLNPYNSFPRTEKLVRSGSVFLRSPSRLTIYLPIVFVVVWSVIIIHGFYPITSGNLLSGSLIPYVFVILSEIAILSRLFAYYNRILKEHEDSHPTNPT